MEERILDYLQREYNPKAVLLAGSRATGKAREDSDWDLFLIESEKKHDGFVEFEGNLLDITHKDLPKGDKFLTIPFGPLYPTKVLLDKTDNELTEVLERTEEAFKKGPLDLYRSACMERVGKLRRWITKVEKYEDTPEIQFFYSGIFYEFAIRSWFEVQNLWSLPPKEALDFISTKNPDFRTLLGEFVRSSGKNQSEIAHKIMSKISRFVDA